ncbi:hypothetical protein EKK58_04260 [Candidatus Dependentiae bacterium]|nr:MAG: hypothetical protein EKK58_04260 [Candidatus Dependentiae bacterium]
MKVLSIDCAIKNCGWSYLSYENKNINIIDFGLLDFTTFPLCKVCSEPSIAFNFDECEPVYCCKGHMKQFNCKKIKKKLTSQEICKNLIQKLKNIAFIDNIDIVILENQPSLQNPTSKAVQVMLMTYFTTINKNVILQNPNQKFYGYKFENNKKKYKDRKLMSIYLIKNTIKKEIFNKLLQYSKTDDICDSILMGYCYFSEEDKKIKDNFLKLIEEYEKQKK